MAFNNLSVVNPAVVSQTFGNNPIASGGKQGETYVSEIHGRMYPANYNNALYVAFVNGVTVPVNAATLASVFTIYNPPGSGINMELYRVDYEQIVTATVIDALGWVTQTPGLISKGTFTTFGTAVPRLIGGAGNNRGQFLTAFTHSGTPTFVDFFAGWGSTSGNQAGTSISRVYDGDLVITPGNAISLAMSTGAGTGSAAVVQAVWAEYPV